MKYIVGFVTLFFAIGLFIHRPHITIVTLFAITFTIGFVVSSAYMYLLYLHTGTFALRAVVAVAKARCPRFGWRRSTSTTANLQP